MRKSFWTTAMAVVVGVVFGAVLVSGLDLTKVGGAVVRDGVSALGGFSWDRGTTARPPDTFDPRMGFTQIAESIVPTVVNIKVTTTPKSAANRRGGSSSGGDDPQAELFRRFFGTPDGGGAPQPQQGSGSGVIISPDGYIITNNHVVGEADKGGIHVVLYDKEEYDATLVGTDPLTDIAVIKIASRRPLPAISVGNSDELKVGAWVVAVGNPFGERLSSTVTAGIVSALGRDIDINRGSSRYGVDDFIQTDAAINPGNSGGALVNTAGQLVGINAAIATHTGVFEGYGFAIPINLARSVADDLIKNGKINRGYIGVQIKPVTSDIAQAMRLERIEGVLVDDVMDNGAAKAAGIKVGDVILSVDGRPTPTPNSLQATVATKHPGDVVSVALIRDGKPQTIRVKLQARTDADVADASSDEEESPETTADANKGATTMPTLGLTVGALDAQTKSDYGLSGGVLVRQTGGVSYGKEIFPGDVIVEANRTAVNNPKEFQSIVSKAKTGDVLLLRVKRRDPRSGDVSATYITLTVGAATGK